MIEAIGLSKHYDGVPVLRNLGLRVERGEIFCLLGANGAGKTTTINLFLSFIRPSAGRALVAGIDVSRDPVGTKRLLGYIPEQVMLYGSLSGLENLTYFAALAGRTSYPQDVLRGFLVQAGLQESAADRPVRTYSKGMRQKVGIAITLAKGAKALLLDEPLSGLDPKAANEFSALLRRLAEEGVAILLATHDLFRARDLGHRIGIMNRGELRRELATEGIGHAELERIYLSHMHD